MKLILKILGKVVKAVLMIVGGIMSIWGIICYGAVKFDNKYCKKIVDDYFYLMDSTVILHNENLEDECYGKCDCKI